MALFSPDAHVCCCCWHFFNALQAEAFLAQRAGDGEASGGGRNGRDLAALHVLGSHPLTLDLAIDLAGDLDARQDKEEQPGGRVKNLPSAWEVRNENKVDPSKKGSQKHAS